MEGVNDALQHPGLQTLHGLGPILAGVDVGPSLVKGMGPVRGGGRVGLKPGAVYMGVKLHTHMVYSLWHILFALQNVQGTFQNVEGTFQRTCQWRKLQCMNICSEKHLVGTSSQQTSLEVEGSICIYLAQMPGPHQQMRR